MHFISFVLIHYAILMIASTETPYEYDDRSYEVVKKRCPLDGRHHYRRRSKHSESRDRHHGNYRDRDRDRDIDDNRHPKSYFPKYYSKEYSRDDDRRDDEKIILRQLDMQFRPFEKGSGRKKLYTLVDENKPGKANNMQVNIPENPEHFYDKPAQVAREPKNHKIPTKVEKTNADSHCNRPNERFESCFAGCASITCDNPRDRLKPCYPFCEAGCICVTPYVRDDRTHKCVLPADCTRGLKGVPDLRGI